MEPERAEAASSQQPHSSSEIEVSPCSTSVPQRTRMKGRIALVDEYPMRQQSTEYLLRMYFSARTLCFAKPSELVVALAEDVGHPCGAICAIGHASVSDSHFVDLMKRLVGLLDPYPLILLTDREDIGQLVVAFQTGVRGYIPTTMNPKIIVQAISMVLSGGVFAPATAESRAQLRECRRTAEQHPKIEPCEPEDVEAFSGPDYREPLPSCVRDTDEKLSHWPRRQFDVFALIVEGKSNKEIACALRMDESTVKSNVRQIMRKLGCGNRTQVALHGRRLGVSVGS